MKNVLLVLLLVAGCGHPVDDTRDLSAAQDDCAQWKNTSSCEAHAGCFASSCPSCSGAPSFIGCIGVGKPGASCPASWLEGCCQLLTSDAACQGLGGCYSVFGSASQFAACYGGQPVCTSDCGISCPSGYSPTSGSSDPNGNPKTDAGASCGCVESSRCGPDLL